MDTDIDHKFVPVDEATYDDYPVDFPDSDGLDPLWVEARAKAMKEDGVPDDDE